MTLIYLDRRSETIHVSRSALSAASENALAGSDMALSAIDRAVGHVWSGNRAALLNELGRIGFELTERRDALANLTRMAEESHTCPDHITEPGHGKAA
jgi:hypothetical protein